MIHNARIKPDDRFELPSGRVVQVTRASRNGEKLTCRYLQQGELDMRSDAELSFTALFLEERGKRLAPAGRCS